MFTLFLLESLPICFGCCVVSSFKHGTAFQASGKGGACGLALVRQRLGKVSRDILRNCSANVCKSLTLKGRACHSLLVIKNNIIFSFSIGLIEPSYLHHHHHLYHQCQHCDHPDHHRHLHHQRLHYHRVHLQRILFPS